MGQTLTHGIYLPDEGERNCYNGLAANWSILDGAVGTIAEHTSALTGKAPLVHTHTKSDITDFPAYGTTAGTICEGNDSRLSDARTPVAHTHVTADVTDLLNTAHEWTKEQVCDEGFTAKSTTIERCVTPDIVKHINFTFKDKNDNGIGAVRRYFRNNGIQELQVFGNTRIKDGQYDETGSDVFFGFSEVLKPDGTMYFSFDGYMGSNLEPLSANQSIGSASNQWNNLYAKNYYYNGVAWGLDKANTWTGDNTYTKYQNIIIAGTEIGVAPNNQNRNGLLFKDKNNETLGWVRSVYDSTGDLSIEMLITNKYSNGALDPNGTQTYQGIKQTLSASGDVYFGWSGKVNNHVVPRTNNSFDLGTSTNKWKTLNGINPGALSFPSASYIDISSNITDRNYGANYYTAPSDGYVCIGSMASSLQISNDTLGFGTTGSTGQDGYASAYIPVRTGNTVRIQVNQTSTDYQYFSFYPCAGNV